MHYYEMQVESVNGDRQLKVLNEMSKIYLEMNIRDSYSILIRKLVVLCLIMSRLFLKKAVL